MKAELVLYNLVHALTESEVVLVRNQLKGKSKKLYERLLQQDAYNKDDLVEHLGYGDDYDRLSALKYLVKDSILTIISGNGKEADKLSVLARIPLHVNALIRKGFYREAEKRIEYGITIAEEFEMFGHLADLVPLWCQVTVKRCRTDGGKPDWNAIFKRLNQANEKSADLVRSRTKFYQVVDMVQTPMSNTDRAEKVRGFLLDLGTVEACKSVRSKLFHLRTEFTLYRTIHDVEKYAACSERIVTILEENPALFDNPSMVALYAKHLFHKAILSIENESYDNTRTIIERLEGITRSSSKGIQIEAEIQQRAWIIHLSYGLKTIDWNTIREVLTNVHASITDVRHQESDSWIRAVLLRQSVELAIYLGDWKLGVKFHRYLQEIAGSRIDPFITVMEKIYELIIFFEQEEFEPLASALRRTRRFFKAQGHISEFTRIWLKFFTDINRKPFKENIITSLHTLREGLSKLASDRQYFDYCNAFDFQAWTTAKINNTTVNVVLKQS